MVPARRFILGHPAEPRSPSCRLGVRTPSGRLPETIPTRLADTPGYTDLGLEPLEQASADVVQPSP